MGMRHYGWLDKRTNSFISWPMNSLYRTADQETLFQNPLITVCGTVHLILSSIGRGYPRKKKKSSSNLKPTINSYASVTRVWLAGGGLANLALNEASKYACASNIQARKYFPMWFRLTRNSHSSSGFRSEQHTTQSSARLADPTQRQPAATLPNNNVALHHQPHCIGYRITAFESWTLGPKEKVKAWNPIHVCMPSAVVR